MLFTRAFTDGIRDPQSRVRESEWRASLVRLRDSIVYCSYCGEENFYDGDALQASGGKPAACWSCHREIQLPTRIRIDKKVVMLNADAALFRHHVDPQKMYDFSQPVAKMVRHPSDPNVWGIRNLSTDNWVSTTAGGAVNDVPPGRTVSLPLARIRRVPPR